MDVCFRALAWEKGSYQLQYGCMVTFCYILVFHCLKSHQSPIYALVTHNLIFPLKEENRAGENRAGLGNVIQQDPRCSRKEVLPQRLGHQSLLKSDVRQSCLGRHARSVLLIIEF